jgi:hypothetical protein
MFSVPLWAVALALAGLAPWIVRAGQSWIERRTKRRTEALLREVGLWKGSKEPRR